MSSAASAASVVSTEGDGSQFTLFLKLPLEVRLMIWEEALPNRIITISLETYFREEIAFHLLPGPATIFGWTYISIYEVPIHIMQSNAVTPVMFFVNKESRKVSLARYEIAFGSLLGRPFYFDFIRDTIYLPHENVVEQFTNPIGWDEKDDTSRLQNLVIGVPWIGRCIHYCAHFIKEMSGLESLTLTVDDQNTNYDGRYFTDRERIDLFRATWNTVNGMEVREKKAVAPKSITWVGLAEMKRLALRGVDGTFGFHSSATSPSLHR